MQKEANEFVWRVRIVAALSLLGGWFGGWGWLSWLAHTTGGWSGWTLKTWVRFAHALVERGFGGEIAVAAAGGAALLVAPALYLFLKKG